MADVKLVIKVPEELYKALLNGYEEPYSKIFSDVVKNGTLLNDVKAEMQRRADDPWNMTVGSASQGLKDAIEILDNIGEIEDED